MALEEKQVNFYEVLKHMREQRTSLVTTIDQYIFAHFVILEYYFGKDFSIPITSEFQNKVQTSIEEKALNFLKKQIDKSLSQYFKTKYKVNHRLTDEEKAKNRFSEILPGFLKIK